MEVLPRILLPMKIIAFKLWSGCFQIAVFDARSMSNHSSYLKWDKGLWFWVRLAKKFLSSTMDDGMWKNLGLPVVLWWERSAPRYRVNWSAKNWGYPWHLRFLHHDILRSCKWLGATYVYQDAIVFYIRKTSLDKLFFNFLVNNA